MLPPPFCPNLSMSKKRSLPEAQPFTEHSTQVWFHSTTAFDGLAVGDSLMHVAPPLPLQRSRDRHLNKAAHFNKVLGMGVELHQVQQEWKEGACLIHLPGKQKGEK